MKEAKLKVISFSNSDVIATSGLQWGNVALKGSPRFSELFGNGEDGYFLTGYNYETNNDELGAEWDVITQTTYIYDAGGKLIASGPLMDVADNVIGAGLFHLADSDGTYYFQLCEDNCKHTN